MTYGESREDYLAALGKRLPSAIEVYWTGPKVKSNKITAEDMRWVTNLIGRKPVYWQNTGSTWHGEYFTYATDPMIAWKDSYYEGFFDQLAFFTYNGDGPYECLTRHDAIWNRETYDPVASSVEAAKKLAGPAAYPQMVEMFKALEAMDDYGWVTPTALAAKNVEQVRKQTDELVKLFDTAPAPLKSRWLSLGSVRTLPGKVSPEIIEEPGVKGNDRSG